EDHAEIWRARLGLRRLKVYLKNPRVSATISGHWIWVSVFVFWALYSGPTCFVLDFNGEGDSLPEDSITKKVHFKESNVNLEDVMVVEDSNTKKVCFKEPDVIPEVMMVVESSPTPSLFWKDMLPGKDTPDVKKSVVDGVPSIDLSERVYQLLEKEMSTSMVLKMLGKVNKLDFNTDSKAQGRYARMAIYVNLGRPLVSKILINGSLQRIEDEKEGRDVGTNIFNFCGGRRWGLCPLDAGGAESRHDTLDGIKKGNNSKGEKIMGSRFQLLVGLEASSTEGDLIKENQRDLKKKGKATLSDYQEKSLTSKKKYVFNGSKKVNLGLSAGKLLNGQACDPKTNTHLKDHNKVGLKLGLVPQVPSAANQQAPLDI
ncbi:hypothetical protein Goshw_001576, partial [Gossypium schwendimanii]|nr:hypothetical protein [Gossypium schwendimanii]